MTYDQRWKKGDPLDEGGQGHTYLCEALGGYDLPKGKHVLKVFKHASATRAKRYTQEVDALTKIRKNPHRSLLTIVDFDIEANRPWYVAEYCPGGTLNQLGGYPADRDHLMKKVKTFQMICEGVDHLHRLGIVHRDIKPHNIFVNDEGDPIVGDFGLSFDFQAPPSDRITETFEQAGPRFFMAPEARDGRVSEPSAKMDSYSLGKVLHYLCSGTPYDRENHRELRDLTKQNTDDSTRLYLYMEYINRILDHSAVFDPDDRWGAGNLSILGKTIHNLIERQVFPIGRNLEMPCRFCGPGTYRPLSKGTTVNQEVGLTLHGGQDNEFWACDTCGHVEWFRFDRIRTPTNFANSWYVTPS